MLLHFGKQAAVLAQSAKDCLDAAVQITAADVQYAHLLKIQLVDRLATAFERGSGDQISIRLSFGHSLQGWLLDVHLTAVAKCEELNLWSPR
jgi:hypothetical protein